MAYVYQRQRSLKCQLQNMLGDLGTVLPHQKRGTAERPARGWYAELTDGEIVFLGDHSLVAGLEVSRLVDSHVPA